MSISPQDLLRKLKPSASFAVDRDSILELARFAIDSGADEFANSWQVLVAPRSRVAKGTVPKGNPKAKDPRVESAESQLKKFGDSRKLKSSESGIALVRFAQQRFPALPEPTKAATASIGGAVKWLASKTGEFGVDNLVNAFVEAFSEATDYTYR